MALTNSYASRSALKTRLGLTDTNDDAVIDAVLGAVSRWIEQFTGRWFFPKVQTRYYTAVQSGRLLVDDLLSVTSLATDADGDRTYEDTWTATDYDLDPANAANETPPEPYTEIAVTPDGDYTFPVRVARGVKIAGSWGYYDVRVTSSATLAEALDISETAVDVSDGTQFGVGQTILIGTEQMQVTGISSNTLTVVRGANGTAAATHDTGATIQVYEYPIVGEACLLQASRIFRRQDAPFGVVGGGEIGTQIVLGKGDPEVRAMLLAFKRWGFA